MAYNNKIPAGINDDVVSDKLAWSSLKIFREARDKSIHGYDENASFLSEEGYFGIRHWNDKWEYYNTSTKEWTDCVPTGVLDPAITRYIPSPMQEIKIKKDLDKGCFKLMYKLPNDTTYYGTTYAIVDRVKIVRKAGSAPENVNDGVLFKKHVREDFERHYSGLWYDDDTFTPEEGVEYFYRFFIYSNTGLCTDTDIISMKWSEHEIYGFEYYYEEGAVEFHDPAAIIYIEDNKYFKPYKQAYASYNSNNIGDWNDVFFYKNLKPCLLNFDGTVEYELKKDDCSYTKDNVYIYSSHLTNQNYQGNVMVGFPLMYIKIEDIKDGDNNLIGARVRIADYKVDNDFTCYAHINANGNTVPFFYYPAFRGTIIDNKIRSIMNQTLCPTANKDTMLNHSEIIEMIKNMNDDNGESGIWYNETISQYMLITYLLLLVGKSPVLTKGFMAPRSYMINSSSTIDSTSLWYSYGNSTNSMSNYSVLKVFGINDFRCGFLNNPSGFYMRNGVAYVKPTFPFPLDEYNGETCNSEELGSDYIPLGEVFIGDGVDLKKVNLCSPTGFIVPTDADPAIKYTNKNTHIVYDNVYTANLEENKNYMINIGCWVTGTSSSLWDTQHTELWSYNPIPIQAGTQHYGTAVPVCMPEVDENEESEEE